MQKIIKNLFYIIPTTVGHADSAYEVSCGYALICNLDIHKISKQFYVDMRLCKCIYFPNPLSVFGLCIEPHPHKLQTVCSFLTRLHADLCIYIYVHKPKRMCAYEKKIRMPNSNSYQYYSISKCNVQNFDIFC